MQLDHTICCYVFGKFQITLAPLKLSEFPTICQSTEARLIAHTVSNVCIKMELNGASLLFDPNKYRIKHKSETF